MFLCSKTMAMTPAFFFFKKIKLFFVVVFEDFVGLDAEMRGLKNVVPS